MTERGFRVLHTYGLSETYGPSTLCTWKAEWDLLPTDVWARLNARQGARLPKNPKANEAAKEAGITLSVEVENILYQHPAILEVSVVARPDEQWGESPCAL
ncbi:Acetate/butyrate--CoA ligase aae7, peroxisomal [Datura stramonium]|uniref:Acetate/butyrate--CoA ligase aae7, peroxisomal n=1 Tax=Datura stramonium TaxID=4076 RepID=A0ABS8UXT6_DATST|nr:Acetate/butyrate--CoA ligase aae7, peroxisomal [Datura stramonium]